MQGDYALLEIHTMEVVMQSVTKRISEIKQPRGGYIRPSDLSVVAFDDGKTLFQSENIHTSIVGLAVDYLTRFLIEKDVRKAFDISLKGVTSAEEHGVKGASNTAETFLKEIEDDGGLGDASIIAACRLVTFDVWYRNPRLAPYCESGTGTLPDNNTIDNIRIMIQRGLAFFKVYGPVIKYGFTFEAPNKEDAVAYSNYLDLMTDNTLFGGYTTTVGCGDGDFLTSDTLWDFKVSKNKPTSKHTLQLLMYWIMGQHSGQAMYKDITRLGIFNPRLNAVYLIDISKISEETIKAVEEDVICY